MPIQPESVEQVADAVRSVAGLQPIGAGTKPALARPAYAALCSTRLRGITEYAPAEFTITALAGTPLAEVEASLSEHGQYLPFDPPLAASGATLGGTVAAGLSGSGRQRFGGLRDFVLGVTFVTGLGEVARGGGRVVKNAAGFDLPKLFVGSQGTLAALVELTFKVFPRPPATRTVRLELGSSQRVWSTLASPQVRAFDLDTLDVEPPATVWVRVGGEESSLDERLRAVCDAIGGDRVVLDDAEDQEVWRTVSELEWLDREARAVRVPLNVPAAARLEQRLARLDRPPPRRYCASGAFAWIAWAADAELATLHEILVELGLRGQIVHGACAQSLVGDFGGHELYRRVKRALDPEGRFPSLLGSEED